MTLVTETKYNIGDIVRIRLNYRHDPRTEVDATICEIIIGGKTANIVSYMVTFDSCEYYKNKGFSCCECRVSENGILKLLCRDNNLDGNKKSTKAGMKNNQPMVLVNPNEYQNRVLRCITSGEVYKYINPTCLNNNPSYKQAIIHGMSIASMLISECTVTAFAEGGDEGKIILVGKK